MTEEPGRLQSMGSQRDLARICMWLSPFTVHLKLSQPPPLFFRVLLTPIKPDYVTEVLSYR